jgi:hypothetical protein
LSRVNFKATWTKKKLQRRKQARRWTFPTAFRSAGRMPFDTLLFPTQYDVSLDPLFEPLLVLMMYYQIGGKDVNLDINRIVAHRHFCNKIWNANKLYYFYCSGYQPASETPSPSEEFSCMDRWILSRLYSIVFIIIMILLFISIINLEACEVIDVSFNSFLFTQMTDALYKFWKEELCDVYLVLSLFFFNFTFFIIIELVYLYYKGIVQACLTGA